MSVITVVLYLLPNKLNNFRHHKNPKLIIIINDNFFSLCLTKHNNMRTYRDMEVYIHVFLCLKLDGAGVQLHVR